MKVNDFTTTIDHGCSTRVETMGSLYVDDPQNPPVYCFRQSQAHHARNTLIIIFSQAHPK